MKRSKVQRNTTTSEDKSFGAYMQSWNKRGYPHMEWDGEAFTPKTPAPTPKLKVNVTLMSAAYEKMGVKWTGSRKGLHQSREVTAVTDSGCQTCTAGEDFLEQIGCPTSYLVPTSHQIMGITSTSLGILGSALVRLELNGEVTRQMVHISKNTKGLYLSETALKELKVLKEDFPHPLYIVGTVSASSCTDDGASSCTKRTPTPDRPEAIPFTPTKENKVNLKTWLIEAFEGSSLNLCTHQPLQWMTGVPMKAVKKKPGSNHPNAYTPIPVPFYWKKPVKADLDQDVRLGIVEPVPQGEVNEWCSRMVITPKANGKPRRTVDFQELNKATLREIHHTPSPINLVASIPGGKLKTVLDAWNGYHSLMLDPESKELTTFITEWGRYRYCRGPQGFHGTGDAYTRRFDDITAGEERYRRCVDDGLLYDDDIESAFWHTFDHLKLCGDNGIVFNREKFKFAEEEVEFAGFEVTMEGFRPSRRIIESIRDFPTPKSITDVRSWFGLVNQVAYAFSESDLMEPFRGLLGGKKKPLYWDEKLDALFKRSKEEILRLIEKGVKAFDMQKPTCLATDWSKSGLGYSLMQKHCKCLGPPNPNCGKGHWQLVFAGSKATNDAQSRYSPTEGECLAAAYGLERCRMYTLGCHNLTLATDHNPLTGILNDRRLDTIANPRLQRLKERTLAFSYKIIYVPGGSMAMKAADALSRHPSASSEPDPVFDEIESVTRSYAASHAENIESTTWRRVNEAAAVDEECATLRQLIADGFPGPKTNLPSNLQRYWGMQDELFTVENVIFKGKKMLIPANLRRQVLEGLHAGHQGVSGMLSNARSRFFWPGLDAAVRQLRNQCRQCNEQAPSQRKEEMIFTPPAEVPFEQVVADLFSLEGHTFLAYADRFSGWLEVERLQSNAFRHVREAFLRWFRTYGVPGELATDGGPPFNSFEYKGFLRSWDVKCRLSSAYYAQSNGRAEAAVKSAKRILLGNINSKSGSLDTDAAAKAIMSHRNTPTQDTGIPPSVMLFGHLLRDHLPQTERKIRPEWDDILNAREVALAKRAVKVALPVKGELQPLAVGDCVQIQNQTGNYPGKWFNTGIIAETLPYRQYKVVVDGSRRVTLRNRKFLKKISPLSRREADTHAEINIDKPMSEEETGVTFDPPVQTIMDDPHHATDLPIPQDPVIDTTHIAIQPQVGSPSDAEDKDSSHPPLRRSTRERGSRKLFQAKLSGKSHH